MEVKQCLIFVLIHAIPAPVDGTKYIRNGENLTHIPAGIPMGVTHIELTDNLITVVDYMEGVFSLLTKLYLDRNHLTVFPELGNCTEVSILSLDDNQIATVPTDRLNVLTKLAALYMRGNRLVAFPDVSGPSSSLHTLNLGGNNFNEMPLFETLGPNMESLTLMENSISAVDQRHMLPVKNVVSFSLSKNGLQSLPDLQLLTKARIINLNDNPALGNLPDGIFPSLTSLDTLMALNSINANTVPWDICLRRNLSMGF